jgi:hypothetical protein
MWNANRKKEVFNHNQDKPKMLFDVLKLYMYYGVEVTKQNKNLSAQNNTQTNEHKF